MAATSIARRDAIGPAWGRSPGFRAGESLRRTAFPRP